MEEWKFFHVGFANERCHEKRVVIWAHWPPPPPPRYFPPLVTFRFVSFRLVSLFSVTPVYVLLPRQTYLEGELSHAESTLAGEGHGGTSGGTTVGRVT